jgi:hydroxyethylthiazole kinase-like sugar kinase family protein|tara:strand:+ start:672 stop:920 length:249 start_codon:yes stop_codon:yes gene_type:complete
MSELNKITQEELTEVQDQQKQIQELLTNIGVLESQKHSALHKIASVNEAIEKTKLKLEEKYGQINIDLKDGTYTLLEEEKQD